MKYVLLALAVTGCATSPHTVAYEPKKITIAISAEDDVMVVDGVFRAMVKGESSQRVADMQTLLINKGYGTFTATSHYRGATEAAVKKFQADHGINESGVGILTMRALRR